mgnify:CR=1 FL=1
MKKLLNINIFMLALLVALPAASKEEIGVASAVNKNTTDLTLEEERKLVQAGYKIIQNHTLELTNRHARIDVPKRCFKLYYRTFL